MNNVEAAILRTVLYADVFNFPMTVEEIHHFLIAPTPIPLQHIEHALKTSPLLHNALRVVGQYIVRADREEIIAVRQKREAASIRLWKQALTYGVWLARLPFVRMVAITGALAMRNAADNDDDLDFVLVTASGRVWTARAFAVLLVRLAKLCGVTICPNYVLAESALEQPRQDLFMAHEVTQMVPLYGFDIYRAMRARNAWVMDYLPNAPSVFYSEPEYRTRGLWGLLKTAAEWCLRTPPGTLFERWEYRRKLRRFAPEMEKPNHAALLDESHVKGHFNDHGHPVLRKYYERLQAYQLEGDTALLLAGD